MAETSARLGKKPSLTQEERHHRKIRARRRFRALVHLVIANRPWLEEVLDEELGENVKRNVQLLTKKKEKKSLLTIQHKAILNKPVEYRTDAEIKILYKIIGGLSCFRKYPEHVKMMLAGVTYFYYYGPNRVIVRQNQEAYALYFIVSGEVIVSITSFDPVLNEKVTINVGTMVPGNMFGEVSLLHDIPRTATITTATPCELLCLKRNDFDIVLKSSVQAQWDEIQRAMKRFTYFDGWDEVAVRECCILAKKRAFAEDQIVLGDNTGAENYVHFLLKGKCRVIEHLLVTVSYVNGVKRYKHYVPPVEPEHPDAWMYKAGPKSASVARLDRRDETMDLKDDERFSNMTTLLPFGSELSALDLEKRRSSNLHRIVSFGRKASISLQEATGTELALTGYQPPSGKLASYHKSSKKLGSKASFQRYPSNIETHFMQVCIFSETACFNLGENMSRRRIVAMTDVELMLIPNYWIWQRNKGNLWTRIQQFMDARIPTTEVVFKQFIEGRKWRAYKKSLLNHILPFPPSNLINNVPYSIRVKEDIEFADNKRK